MCFVGPRIYTGPLRVLETGFLERVAASKERSRARRSHCRLSSRHPSSPRSPATDVAGPGTRHFVHLRAAFVQRAPARRIRAVGTCAPHPCGGHLRAAFVRWARAGFAGVTGEAGSTVAMAGVEVPLGTVAMSGEASGSGQCASGSGQCASGPAPYAAAEAP
jgi:hypothetical protein